MSKLEEALLAQIAAAGLPAPKTEFSFSSGRLFTRHKPPRPRSWRFDFCWPLYRIVLECHGGTWLGRLGGHTGGKGYESNRYKAVEATRDGWVVIEVTAEMVGNGYAVESLRDVMRQQRHRLRHQYVETG